MVQVRLFISFALAAFAVLFPVRASAWEVCNETSFGLRVAVATTIDGALTPKGWNFARPGQCLLFTAAEGTARYVYAESSSAHQGGIREWRGATELCTDETDFESNNEVSCSLQDMGSRHFLSVDPAEEKSSFVEIEEYGDKAPIAGLQRLLRDLGYTVPKIDGRLGRQTNRSLAKFLKAEGLAKTMRVEGKLDALAAASLKKADEIGITLCNKTEARMWTAVAYRQAASWEARGWWAIEPGQCLRPHTQSIKSDDAHIFALLENEGGDDKILKSTTAVPAQFCISQSRFSATQRENCADRGYRAASFRPLPTNKDGVTLTLTAADFTASKTGGLRR